MKMKSLDVSAAQQTSAGCLIANLYYGDVLKMLKWDEYDGYPRNGGSHTLYLRLSQKDLEAFLLLVKEHYGKKGPMWAERAEAFIAHVKTKKSKQ